MTGNEIKTVLITGINGFLGSHLAQYLMKYYNIIGLAHSLENLFRVNNLKLKVYSSQDNIEDIFKKEKIYSVIHTATIYRRENDPIKSLLETNILLPSILFELSEKYNVNRFINTDSFFNTKSNKKYAYLQDYTLSKKHSLAWLRLQQKNCTLLNMKIFHMYGENDSPSKFVPFIIDKLKKNESIDLTLGEQVRDFIYIEDVVSAYKVILDNSFTDNSFNEFDVCTGKSITVKKFVEIAKQAINSSSILNWGSLPYRENEMMISTGNPLPLEKIGWIRHFSIKDGLFKTISFEYKNDK